MALCFLWLHADAFEVIAFGVVVAIDVHDVDLSFYLGKIYKREFACRRDPTRRDHRPETTISHRLRCPRAKHHSHDPIDRARRAAALRVSQHNRPRFVWSLSRDSFRQHFADATKSHVPKRVATIIESHHSAALR